MVITGEMPAGAGTIEDAINRARQRFAGDLESQSKYVKIAMDLIKRDGGDGLQTIKCQVGDYDCILTGFPSGGEVFAYWELYKGVAYVANGVEKLNPSNHSMHLLFSSTPKINEPIVLPLVYK